VADKIRVADRRTLVMCLIETAEGIRNVDAIAAVPGVDVLRCCWLLPACCRMQAALLRSTRTRAHRDDHQETEMLTHQNTFCDAPESMISDYEAGCNRMEKKS
jgi:citrate lyase beta subunit